MSGISPGEDGERSNSQCHINGHDLKLMRNNKIASHLVIAGTVRMTARRFRKMSSFTAKILGREVIICVDIADCNENNLENYASSRG